MYPSAVTVCAACLCALIGSAGGQTQPADDGAAKLWTQLKALQDVKTITARFTCEKRLALLESPLVSEGRLWIGKGEGKSGREDGAVRFLSEQPYVSDLILAANGKVYARSQHEKDWTQTSQSSRPGLTAVMTQLGGWATGDMGTWMDMYAITAEREVGGGVPSRPGAPKASTTSAGGLHPAEIFELTPTNKDLALAVKTVKLAFDSSTHQLLFVEIQTRQDDVTRYWFYDVKVNGALPPDIFKPGTSPPASGARQD